MSVCSALLTRPLNPLLSVDNMQLRNKYRELEGVKEEGVLLDGCEEIYSL